MSEYFRSALRRVGEREREREREKKKAYDVLFYLYARIRNKSLTLTFTFSNPRPLIVSCGSELEYIVILVPARFAIATADSRAHRS